MNRLLGAYAPGLKDHFFEEQPAAPDPTVSYLVCWTKHPGSTGYTIHLICSDAPV